MSEKVKLGELYNISSGGTPSKKNKEYYENGTIKWVKTGDLKEKYLYDVGEYITKEGLDNSSAKIYDADTVLLAMYGATIGATSILKTEACTNQACASFKKIERIIPEYLYYFLKSKKDKFVKDSFGGAQPNISISYLKNIEINLIGKDVQFKIVNELDRIENIIKLKKEQIKKLNELIKSQFVEMFENQKFDLKTLNEISVIKGEYGSGASAGEFIEGQPRYVRITDIQEDGRLNNQSMASPKNEDNIDKYILRYGDVLFARTGATVGKTYKYNENEGYCIRFRIDINICNPDYIFIYTKTDNYKKWVENKQRVVAQPNINAKEYGNDLKIPIPPIELQNEFADFVKQIDKQKFEIENSLKEMQELYESLMEKYFG